MRKGDLAFFYHSNTKVPGVAGIMEIVEEHSIDGTPIKADLRAYILTSDCRICL
jgi:predicted RNA-binding protein with PUA-like domain